ncbi:nucleotide-binding domain-containing protein [Pseudomonas syringae]|uniref:nucleotide-binding domain-containing protein n=1 Tax=Pseudomonas syringae TaxID=317 RepID=UPI000D75CE75|nr:adenylate/guanylate cyclase domain-containing protein [Pseudomonas syringae]
MLDSEIKKTRKKTFSAMDGASYAAMEGLNEHLYKSLSTSDVFSQESIQQDIRTSFGRPGVNLNKIGTHPDFIHLAETDDQENHYICSLFLDIKNSTRLTFIYELHEVVAIKNTILKAAAEVVRAMDGHVHRFMGDALLAFFGGKTQDKDDSIIDAINCASVLESLMTGTIIPVLEQEYSQNLKADYLGFRIGLDYGSDDDVLWSSYGFKDVYEVTPTSFFVDVAAKLQSIAGKNKSMLGSNIIEEIDLPEAYTKIRTRTQTNEYGDTETFPLPNLPRSYTDRDGRVHTYKVRELDHAKYRDLLPFPTELKESHPNSGLISCPGISFKCFTIDGDISTEYPSISKMLKKNISLKFKVVFDKEVHGTQKFPLELKLTKRNYGKEAQLKGEQGVFPITKTSIIKNSNYQTAFFRADPKIHIDSTAYRGLHTMEAAVTDASGTVIFRDIIGIYIR